MENYIDYKIIRNGVFKDDEELFYSSSRTECRKKFNWFKKHFVSGVIKFVKVTVSTINYTVIDYKIIDTADLTELHKAWHDNMGRLVRSALDSYCESYLKSLSNK